LTAKNRDQLWNPTLGNRLSATFTFFRHQTAQTVLRKNRLENPTCVLMAVFQENVSGPHVPGKELFGALIFTGCGPNENVKLPIKTMQNHQLAYCFFIHHWIPERKGTVDFMVPVQCQYPLLDNSLKQ